MFNKYFNLGGCCTDDAKCSTVVGLDSELNLQNYRERKI